MELTNMERTPAAAAVADGTFIDRSADFDQTRISEAAGKDAIFTDRRHVSPAILEHRVEQLRLELRAERALHIETQDRLAVASKRIAAFEKMLAAMAEKLDQAEADFAQLIGMTPDKAAKL